MKVLGDAKEADPRLDDVLRHAVALPEEDRQSVKVDMIANAPDLHEGIGSVTVTGIVTAEKRTDEMTG